MTNDAHRIVEFEALRGILAIWVLVGHVFKYSGYLPEDLGFASIIAEPGMAVDIFIILSGFVIFALMDRKHEGYLPFIIRRFFRLYPVYLVVLVVSAFLAISTLEWREAFPWKTEYTLGTLDIAKATVDYLPKHFAVHLTMLHGLIPDWLLPYSQYAFIGQAWSISVEWQFYLVAPLFFAWLRTRPLLLTLALAVLVGVHSRYWLGEGFAVMQAQYFLAGILSYFAYKHARLTGQQLILGAALVCTAAVLISAKPLSFILWAIALSAAMHTKVGGRNTLSTISTGYFLQMLGRISYSLYLWHFIVMLCLSRLLLTIMSELGQVEHAALLMLATLSVTVLLSLASFALVEQPGMNFGHRLVQVLPSRFTKHLGSA